MGPTELRYHCVIDDESAKLLKEAFEVFGLTARSNDRILKVARTIADLDGSRNILPAEGPYANAGYVSGIASTGSVTLHLPKVHTASIPGVTITWSGEYGEYATVFTVTAKNGNTVVAETTVTDNKSNHSLVYLDISNYYDDLDLDGYANYYMVQAQEQAQGQQQERLCLVLFLA